MKFKYSNDAETKFIRALLYVMREYAIKYNYYLSDVGYANLVKFKEQKRVNVLSSVDYYSNRHQPRISKVLDEIDHIVQPDILFYKHHDNYIFKFVDDKYNMIRCEFIICYKNQILIKEIEAYNDGYALYYSELKESLLQAFKLLHFNDITLTNVTKNIRIYIE